MCQVPRGKPSHPSSRKPTMAASNRSPGVDSGFMFHWTLKSADLNRTLLFLESGLGMHVIRHEEHSKPCPITCNGDIDSPWSKTMVGYGEEESSFVIEVVYNYTRAGQEYTLGNDLDSISILDKGGKIVEKMKELNHPIEESPNGISIVHGPDGNKWRLVPESAVEGVEKREERFLVLSLRVPEPESAGRWYRDVFGMKQSKWNWNTQKGSVLVGYDEEQCQLEFLPSAEEIRHEDSIGRLALGSLDNDNDKDVRAVTEYVKASNDMSKIKHDMKYEQEQDEWAIVILYDPWGYEVCWLNGQSFRRMVEKARKEAKDTLDQRGTLIDWDFRSKKLEDIHGGRHRGDGHKTDTTQQRGRTSSEPFVRPPRYAERRRSIGGSSDAKGEFDGPLLNISSREHWELLLEEKPIVFAGFLDNSDPSDLLRDTMRNLGNAHPTKGTRFAIVDGEKQSGVLEKESLRTGELPVFGYYHQGRLIENLSLREMVPVTDEEGNTRMEFVKRHTRTLVDRERIEHIQGLVARVTHELPLDV